MNAQTPKSLDAMEFIRDAQVFKPGDIVFLRATAPMTMVDQQAIAMYLEVALESCGLKGIFLPDKVAIVPKPIDPELWNDEELIRQLVKRSGYTPAEAQAIVMRTP